MKLKYIVLSALTAVVLFGSTSCEKSFVNPNAATKDQVLQSADGLMGMVVGLKQQWSVGATSALYASIASDGLTTKELVVLNTGNGDLAALEAGKGTLGAGNAIVSSMFTSCNLTKANAQLLIDNAKNVPDAGTSAGIRAYGHFFKALAIGTMAQFWEQVPVETVSAGDYLGGKLPSFIPRADALNQAIQLLKDADALIKTTPISATFNGKVGTDISLPNVLQALIARYSLMVAKYDDALAAANIVSPTVISAFKYDAVNTNPVFTSGLASNNVVGGAVNFGLVGALKPDSTDGRIPFYLGGTTLSKATGFFKSTTDQIPVYLPSEMILIKAEALARQNKLLEAVIELNKIRQKTTDPLSVTAKGTAYVGALTQAEVLLDIYRQRCIELYMTNMRLEDSRRFGRPNPTDAAAERSRNFYPYPSSERDNNKNTPADPAI